MAQNTLTYLCLKENVICLQPRRDKLPGFYKEGGEAEAQKGQCWCVITEKPCAGICLLSCQIL